LIELMVVVAILGILAAIGIPAFRTVLFRAKTAEATANLNMMFKGAAAYYSAERAGVGQTGALLRGCTVDDPPSRLPINPGRQKQMMPNTDGSFRALGFVTGGYILYSYGLVGKSSTSECLVPPNTNNVYTLYANGDLDGDSTTSNFELAVGSDVNNELYHARGLYVENELE
jgi:prepilin-type N-terminal cleavage/methylation domain-containing protein